MNFRICFSRVARSALFHATRVLYLLCVVAGLVAAPAAQVPNAEDGKPLYRDGILLVGWHANVSAQAQAQLLRDANAQHAKVIGQGVHVLRVPPGRVAQTAEALRRAPEVRYAEPDYRHTFSATPNDTHISRQWASQNTGQTVNGVVGTSGADESAWKAWNVTTGSRSVVVAVLDSGIDYNHPDLAANIWSNPGLNGCTASTHGFNVLTNTCDPMDDDATSFKGHGTHVAGIIGAVGDNTTGVAGVNWQVGLMAVKWVNSGGSGFTSDLIEAMDWVIQAKQAGVDVRIVNDSQTFAGTASSTALSDEIDALGANDILFVTAAGNSGSNNDTTARYPCNYSRPNEICAAASDQNDSRWSSSNYGSQTVDLAAPGVNIWSTQRNSSYGFLSGCSMSAAQVSGAAALVLSQGYQSVSALRAILTSAVDPLPEFATTTRSGGRLNVCKAVAGCAVGLPVNTSLPLLTGTPSVGQQLNVSAGAWDNSPTDFRYQWKRCDSSGANCLAIPSATASTYSVAASDNTFTLRAAVTAINSMGSSIAVSEASAVVSAAVDASGISLVQSNAIAAQNVLSVVAPFRVANSAGNLLVAFVRASTTNQSITLTDSASNVWKQAVRQHPLTDDHQIRIFYAANSRPGANSVTAKFSATNAQPYLAVFEYAGISTTTPLDVSSSARGTGTSVTTGTSPTTHRNNALLFVGLGLPSNSATAVTAGAGFSLEQQSTQLGTPRAVTEDGIATAIGTFNGRFTLSANASWSAALAVFSAPTATPSLSVSTTSLPDGTAGSAYNATLSATGGTPPYSWSLASGSALPGGLSLSTDGTISGTPTTAGTATFSVEVADSSAIRQTATNALSILVNPATVDNPINLLQSASVQGTAVTSVSSPFPVANTAGNLIVAFVRMSTTSQTVQVTDTAGNVYTDAVSQVQTTDGHQVHIFYAKNIVGGANAVTVTFSASNNHPWLAIYEFNGLSVTAPLDQFARAQGSGTAPNSGLTPATTSAKQFIFAGLGLPSSSTVTAVAGSGYALQQGNAFPGGTSRAANEAMVVNTSGQFAGTFSLSGNANWTAVVATFKQ